MASRPHNTPYSHSAPSSYPRQAPPPCPGHGQSRTASLPSSRQPTRKKSFNPENNTEAMHGHSSMSRAGRAIMPIALGTLAWVSLDIRTLGHGTHMDNRTAENLSGKRFLVLITSVGPGDEISFLFLYNFPPGLPASPAAPQPRHSLVLNATTPCHRHCVAQAVPIDNLHVWTTPAVTAKVTEVHPGRRPPVGVGEQLYAIKHYSQADLNEQNVVWSETDFNDGRLRAVTSSYSREARVQLCTDIGAYSHLTASDPCVLLGYLSAGHR
ncbi:hypothetical protein AURDEDRAFT_185393 [Auricularia subglabra TFB-10046 SS5]|nr:hypothetical protein AURDEDRAFT_185393 [Auricularia subglabra TFB-10046 SS5]